MGAQPKKPSFSSYATNDWHVHHDRGGSVTFSFFLLVKKHLTGFPHCQLNLHTLTNIGVSGPLWNVSIAICLTTPRRFYSIWTLLPISPCHLILYAEDIVLYRPIQLPSDVDTLQADVDLISSWVRAAGLQRRPNW